MPDRMSAESIYVDLVEISKRAKIITRCHCSLARFFKPIPPPPGSGCYGPEIVVTPEQIHAALLDLANRVRAVADEYEDLYLKTR